MKLKISNIFSLFNQGKKENNTYNFFKRKNIKLGIFGLVFIFFVTAIFLILNFSENTAEFKQKTTIEIPCSDQLEEEDIEEIKNITIRNLHNNCSVQKSFPIKEGFPYKNKIKISYFEPTNNEENEKAKKTENIIDFVSEIKEKFPNKITVNNKEEIIFNVEEIADIKEFGNIGEIIGLAIVLFIVILYYMFAFRKLNGFFVAISFIAVLIFNFAVISGLFLITASLLNIKINSSMILPFILILAITTVNIIFNSSFLFRKLQNIVIATEKEKLYLIASNEAINENLPAFISNFSIFTIFPVIAFVVLFIANCVFINNFESAILRIPYVLIYIIAEIICFLVSIFIEAQLWASLKRAKV